MISSASRRAVVALNLAGVAASALFAARGVRRPGYLHPSQMPTGATAFWSASSAVRTGALAAPLAAALVTGSPAAPPLLAVAALVQLADGALGIWQRRAGMTIAPVLMGLAHLTSARLLSRPPRRSPPER